jgi:hypothetical protein
MIKNMLLKFLCMIGVHDWEHLETHYLPTRYSQSVGLRITDLGRKIHYGTCNRCGKWGQYYPTGQPDGPVYQDYPEETCPWKD